MQSSICAADAESRCHAHAAALRTADSIDIDYDAISHALTVSGFWSAPEGRAAGWTETITARGDKVEVGILGVEGKGSNVEEMKVGGGLDC